MCVRHVQDYRCDLQDTHTPHHHTIKSNTIFMTCQNTWIGLWHVCFFLCVTHMYACVYASLYIHRGQRLLLGVSFYFSLLQSRISYWAWTSWMAVLLGQGQISAVPASLLRWQVVFTSLTIALGCFSTRSPFMLRVDGAPCYGVAAGRCFPQNQSGGWCTLPWWWWGVCFKISQEPWEEQLPWSISSDILK